LPTIERIHAREVFDSRGKPTVEVEVQCGGARPGRAIVPSGASTGRFEALELRDGDERLDGDGVLRAVANVNGEIAAALLGEDAVNQPRIDRLLCNLDGSPNKSRLGANAILGASLATAHAAAESKGESLTDHFHSLWTTLAVSHQPPTLPLPMVNMISGGLHAGGNLDIQDVLIVPVGAESFRQALDWTVTVYRRLGRLLCDAGYEGRLVGDEGGYGPKLTSNREALEFVVRAIESAKLKPADDVAIALDVASTHFYDETEKIYRFAASHRKALTAELMIDMLTSWVDEFPVVSIEDGLAEDDWAGWKELTTRLGHRLQLIGDDLFVTNLQRLERGIAEGVANSILIKLNQIGTLTETLQTMARAIAAGYRPVVSARSGETEDTTIADLAVATAAGQIKIGSVARSERLAKYNRLLRLSEEYPAYVGGPVLRIDDRSSY
jgi:enolase 1/2/3